jgi:MFS family permease
MGAVSRWLVPAIGLGILLNPLNSSMISVAVPRLEDAFHLNFAEVSWAIVVFYLVSAVAQPVMGRISDVIGRKRLFLTGLVTSLAGSLAAACTTEFAWLLVFRGLQAFGTSMVASVGLSIVRLSITEGRARAVALVSVFLTGAAAFGPAAGGFLLHWTSWQSIFWINIPFVAASFSLAVWAIPRDAGPVAAAKMVKSPMRLFFGTPALLRVNAQFILVNLVYYTFFFGFPTYLERLRQLDTLAVGLLMLVLGVAALVGSAVAGRWIDKAGRRPVLATSGVLMAVGAAPLALLGGDSSVVLIATILGVMGLAGGLFNVGLQVALFKAAPAEISGLASGLFLTSRYGGTMLSTLVLDLAFPRGPTAGGLTFLALVLMAATLTYLGLELGAGNRRAVELQR